MYFRDSKCRRNLEEGESSLQSRMIREDFTEELNLNAELKDRYSGIGQVRSTSREERAFLVRCKKYTKCMRDMFRKSCEKKCGWDIGST